MSIIFLFMILLVNVMFIVRVRNVSLFDDVSNASNMKMIIIMI